MKRNNTRRHARLSFGSFATGVNLLYAIAIAAVCLMCSSLFVSGAYADGERVVMGLSASSIYEGESTVLSVSVVNYKLDEEPNVEALSEDFNVNSLGSSTQSSVNVQYLNGAPKRVETKAIIYQYELTPKHSGVLTIASPQMKVDGRPVTADPVILTVKGSTQTDIVLLESSVSPQEAIYPLIPFEITVDVLVKAPPQKYAETDLLGLISQQLGAPQLIIPWLQSRSVMANTVVDEELEDWLEKLNDSRSGFALNNFQLSRSPFDFGFSFFDERRPAMFLPKPERVERPDASGNTVEYFKYSFKRTYRAQAPTTLQFAASTLKGRFVNFENEDEPQPEAVYISTKPFTVTIQTIPEDQTPNNYVGIYGSVKQMVSVSSTEVAKGDAFTLTIAYKGYGAFEGAKAPDLSTLLAKDGKFKCYPASERALEDGVAFDYKLRPLEQGVQTIPEIKASYFNVEQKNFTEETSSPIKINVRESLLTQTDDEDDEDIAQTQADHSNASLTLAEQLEAEKKRTRAALTLVAALVGLGIAVALVFGAIKFVKYNKRRIEASNKRLIDNAQKRLALGLEQTAIAPIEGLQSLRIAFVQLIGKQFVQSVDALTDAEIVEFFETELDENKPSRLFKLDKQDVATRQENIETLRQMRDFYKKAEQLRFGGARSVDPKFTSEVQTLFHDWVKLLCANIKKLSSVAVADVQK